MKNHPCRSVIRSLLAGALLALAVVMIPQAQAATTTLTSAQKTQLAALKANKTSLAQKVKDLVAAGTDSADKEQLAKTIVAYLITDVQVSAEVLKEAVKGAVSSAGTSSAANIARAAAETAAGGTDKALAKQLILAIASGATAAAPAQATNVQTALTASTTVTAVAPVAEISTSVKAATAAAQGGNNQSNTVTSTR